MATSWMEINAQAFNHNVAQYKKLLGPKLLAAVVKGNAYGHGQALIARLAQNNPLIDWLCVANLSEAIQLRIAGIAKPILVMSCIDTDVALAVVHDIAIICADNQTLERLSLAAITLQKTATIHIKVDTGLSRFGVSAEDAVTFVQKARGTPGIFVQGIFTHFAQSQEQDQEYTREQYAQFKTVLHALESLGITIPLRHCANTAAVSMVGAPECNFARVGAGLYGFWPSQAVKQVTQQLQPDMTLKPVLSWKARICGLKHVLKGTSVGYDRTFIAQKDTTIALLPIGYYDGYDRRFSNTGFMLVHGQVVPVIGRVCMNVVLLDVTDVAGIATGDEVTVLTDHPVVNASYLAQLIHSYNAREITTRLSLEVPRVLVQDDLELKAMVEHEKSNQHQV